MNFSDADRHEAIGRRFDRLDAANFEGRDHTALLDLCHDPLLPSRRKPGNGFVEGVRCDDRIHEPIVAEGDIYGPSTKCYSKKHHSRLDGHQFDVSRANRAVVCGP